MFLHERRHFLFPQRRGEVAPVPVDEPAHPFHENDLVVRRALGHGGSAPVDFPPRLFAHLAEQALADFFQCLGRRERKVKGDWGLRIEDLGWGIFCVH